MPGFMEKEDLDKILHIESEISELFVLSGHKKIKMRYRCQCKFCTMMLYWRHQLEHVLKQLHPTRKYVEVPDDPADTGPATAPEVTMELTRVAAPVVTEAVAAPAPIAVPVIQAPEPAPSPAPSPAPVTAPIVQPAPAVPETFGVPWLRL